MSFCVDCGHEETVMVDYSGHYYYSCPFCADYDAAKHKETDIRCSRCGCFALREIVGAWDYNEEGMEKSKRDLSNEFRPSESFECKGCGRYFPNPEYEKYLLTKAMVAGKLI